MLNSWEKMSFTHFSSSLTAKNWTFIRKMHVVINRYCISVYCLGSQIGQSLGIVGDDSYLVDNMYLRNLLKLGLRQEVLA